MYVEMFLLGYDAPLGIYNIISSENSKQPLEWKCDDLFKKKKCTAYVADIILVVIVVTIDHSNRRLDKAKPFKLAF